MGIQHIRRSSIISPSEMTPRQRVMFENAKQKEEEYWAKNAHRDIIFGDYADEVI